MGPKFGTTNERSFFTLRGDSRDRLLVNEEGWIREIEREIS